MVIVYAKDHCDSVGCTATFDVGAYSNDLALDQSCPTVSLDGCSTQSIIDAAWMTWMSSLTSMTASGGCNQTIQYGTPLNSLVKPSACDANAQSVSVIVFAKDHCDSVGCTATFDVGAYSNDLALDQSCPTVSLDGCSTQSIIDAAWMTWMASLTSMTASGGCNQTIQYGTPLNSLVKPSACDANAQSVSVIVFAKRPL